MTEPEQDSVAFEDPAYRAAVVDLLGAITYGEISAFQRLTDDAKLATLLSEQGLRVARRTITKYRTLMRVPSVEVRRTLGRSQGLRAQA